MDLLLNPVVVSVVVLCVLCLCRVNVLLSMILAAITAGIASGTPIEKTMELIAQGFSANATTALAYILLGTFAVAIAYTGLMEILVQWIGKHLRGRAAVFCFLIAAITCLSQNVVPVHIAFIPLLIPPLLVLMDKMRLDRRAMACSLCFGLTAPYIALPLGFGLIFQGIIADNISSNGLSVTVKDVASVAWILGLSMLVGLAFAILVSYRGKREYKAEHEIEVEEQKTVKFTIKHAVTLLAIAVVVAVQLWFSSLPLAALAGLVVMIVGRAIEFNNLDNHLASGLSMMGLIAFVMLIAGGYALVLKESGAVDALIKGAMPYIGHSKWIAAFVVTMIGLIVTMGIGTSFGTVPILAVIYVPLCSAVGFSTAATILLITAAAALGDAGSPASDSTLGPTSGLNADGKHSHIWDTCVPTFLHFNIPLAIAGIIGAQFL